MYFVFVFSYFLKIEFVYRESRGFYLWLDVVDNFDRVLLG